MRFRNINKKGKRVLKHLYKKLEHNTRYYIGYAPNAVFDYSDLYPFLKFAINNLGDSFKSKDPMSTHNIEKQVITFFASITNAPKDFSGYITNGSTEGNLYGLYLARKRFPNAIAYFSAHSHYSIPKNLDILQIPTMQIPTLRNGEIDYSHLVDALIQNQNRPAIIAVNIGTTVISAIDNINKIKEALIKANITDYFLHADAAFDGMILPFVDNPPSFGFDVGIDSITISCNKLIGSPIPCSVVLTKQYYVDLINRTASCVRRLDTTISGSRNGITPLFIWHAINTIEIEGFKKIISDGFRKAEYTIKLLNKNEIPAWKNQYALTVVIPEVSSRLLEKWHVPTEHGWSSITMLPKTSYEMIDEFCQDLINERKGLPIKNTEKLIY